MVMMAVVVSVVLAVVLAKKALKFYKIVQLYVV
jgi:hypothetical protein